MEGSFDPYHKWLGIPPEEQPPNYYRLLGLRVFENDPDVIEYAADARMLLLRSLQAGPHSDLCQRLLSEITSARRCLLDAECRENYNEGLLGAASEREVQVAAQIENATPSPPPPVHPVTTSSATTSTPPKAEHRPPPVPTSAPVGEPGQDETPGAECEDVRGLDPATSCEEAGEYIEPGDGFPSRPKLNWLDKTLIGGVALWAVIFFAVGVAGSFVGGAVLGLIVFFVHVAVACSTEPPDDEPRLSTAEAWAETLEKTRRLAHWILVRCILLASEARKRIDRLFRRISAGDRGEYFTLWGIAAGLVLVVIVGLLAFVVTLML